MISSKLICKFNNMYFSNLESIFLQDEIAEFLIIMNYKLIWISFDVVRINSLQK